MKGKNSSDPTAAEAFQRVVALLEGGARMTHDTPFSGDQGLLESISWNSSCIWGDDDATHGGMAGGLGRTHGGFL